MTKKLNQEQQLNKHAVTGSVYKILNLYACLGGNRYKWDEVAKEKGIEIEVTAVEYDEELARMYKERFPNDKVIVCDAHKYLLENFKDFYLHGEAIAIGMVVEAILSVEKTNLKEEQLNEIFTCFNRIFKLPKLDKKLFKEYLKLMIHDKKNSDGKLSFSLLSNIGECTWDVFCNGKEIEKAFNQYNKMIK